MSAAGDALAMFPPIVPRFWVATPPVSAAARQTSGHSACSASDRITSAYVVIEPTTISSSVTSTPRSSPRPRRLRYRPGGSLPASSNTIRSVPPANGRHVPGSCARISSASVRLAGARRSNRGRNDLTTLLYRPRVRIRRCACNRCTGTGCRQARYERRPPSAAVSARVASPPRAPCPACRCRTGRHRA